METKGRVYSLRRPDGPGDRCGRSLRIASCHALKEHVTVLPESSDCVALLDQGVDLNPQAKKNTRKSGLHGAGAGRVFVGNCCGAGPSAGH